MPEDCRQLIEYVSDSLSELENFPSEYSHYPHIFDDLEPRLKQLEESGIDVSGFRKRVQGLRKVYERTALKDHDDDSSRYDDYDEMYRDG